MTACGMSTMYYHLTKFTYKVMIPMQSLCSMYILTVNRLKFVRGMPIKTLSKKVPSELGD